MDVSTRAARAALDRCVLEALRELYAGLRCGAGRQEVAERLLTPKLVDAKALRAVSASLKRGMRDGWAKVDGKGSWSKYRPVDQELEQA